MIVFTIGHSTRSIDDFIGLLQSAGADCVVDVRRFPGSRRHPQFNADALRAALGKVGIAYRHIVSLGGRRGKPSEDTPSPNTLWREQAFRNYADYAMTREFQAGFDELLRLTRERRPAIMCAEALWWRCHRRIITDYLLASGITVEHILDADKVEPAHLTPGATVQSDGSVLYRAAPG